MDSLWTYEPDLPDLVGRLDQRSLQPGDDRVLYEYIAGAAVRHGAFGAEMQHRFAAQGQPAPQGDDIQVLRMMALLNELRRLPTWRWRVLHSPADAPRFMITDRGWIYVGEPDWSSCGLFVPMGPRVAVLGYLDHPELPPRRPPFKEHLDLVPSWVQWFNSAAWGDPTVELLMAHPEDRRLLEGLPQHRDLRPNRYGPYRHRHTVGLFD